MLHPTTDDVLSIRQGRLFIEERDATALADEFGTPLYVVSERRLRHNVRRYQRAFSTAWGGPAQILASFKANHSLALRAIVTEEGGGCDCFGVSELRGAISSHVWPPLVSVNGSFKDAATIRMGVDYGARITLDAPYEFDLAVRSARELGKVARIAIRIRPWFDQITAHSDLRDEYRLGLALHVGKYGVPPEQVVELARAVTTEPSTELVGFHFHGGRHSLDPAVWHEIGAGYGRDVSAICAQLDEYVPAELDCGGGFPSPLDAVRRGLDSERDRPPPPPIEEFADAMASGLAGALEAGGVDRSSTALQVEPGRGLYADTGVHLARVLAIKEAVEHQPWRWVGVDTTVINLHDIPFLHARFEHVVANRADAAADATADIVGITCMVDRITPDARVPVDVAAGDVVAFLGTGAYQEASSANFNALPRPASVLVNGGSAEVIRRRETVDDVFARDIVPQRLSAGPHE